MTQHSPHDIPWDALARHFAGDLSDGERHALDRWVAGDPARAELVDELRRIWSDAADLRQAWDAEAALGQIKAKRSAPPARVLRLTSATSAPPSPWRRVLRWSGRVAAAVGVIVGGTFAVNRAVRLQPPAEAQVSTPRGQRATLRLADGTEVLLAPASTIRYSIDARRGPRMVYLDGAAAFSVKHDATRPFTVRMPQGIARDLGTRFVARAYADDSAAVVAVAEGKVALRPLREAAAESDQTAIDSLLLVPQDGGTVTRAGRLAALPDIETDRLLGWIAGRLEFRETPMRDVAVTLGRWYNLDVRLIGPAVARKRVTASFKDEPVDEVLRLLQASLGAAVTRRGNVVIVQIADEAHRGGG